MSYDCRKLIIVSLSPIFVRLMPFLSKYMSPELSLMDDIWFYVAELHRELRRSVIVPARRTRANSHAPQGEAQLTHTLYAHRTVTQLRNERNTNLMFPYFYVTYDPEPLCSPTLYNFTGWFWSSPWTVLYKQTSLTVKTSETCRATIVNTTHGSQRSREFFRSFNS